MNKKPKQKNRRLLIQIAFIVIPLFLVMFAAALYLMYTGSVKGFLEAQNEHMSEILEKESGMAVLSCSAFLDCWEEHPELDEPDISEDEKKQAEEYFGNNGWVKTGEWMASQSDEVRQYTAVYTFSLLNTLFEIDDSRKDYDSLFLIDINPPNEGFVFWELGVEGIKKSLGDRLALELSDHSVLEDMIRSPSSKIVFEQTKDFIVDGSQHMQVLPMQ